jgi:hypothetical protein
VVGSATRVSVLTSALPLPVRLFLCLGFECLRLEVLHLWFGLLAGFLSFPYCEGLLASVSRLRSSEVPLFVRFGCDAPQFFRELILTFEVMIQTRNRKVIFED